jgi:hypothetical protein
VALLLGRSLIALMARMELEDGSGKCSPKIVSTSILTFNRLFIVQGVATVGAAIPAPFLLLDWPSTARQLTPREREIASGRVRADGMHVAGSGEGEKSISHGKAFVNAISNWRLWLLCAGYMTIIGCYSLSYFNPTLVQGLGYKGSMAQYSKCHLMKLTAYSD